ncbi:MAG: hypothetical protein WAK71_19035 [Streptosporangiaceae bacterium]
MPRLSHYDDVRLASIPAQQDGIIARRQALACSMTDKAVRYRITSGGSWQVVLPGIYASERGRLTDKQRAVCAFLYASRPIAITGPAAMAWHGLGSRSSEFVDVLVPLHYHRSDAGFVRLHCTSILPGADYQDGCVSYAPLDRAIADTVRQLTDMAKIRDLVASGVQRGKVEVWQLARELNLGPTQGSARLRVALAEVSDGVRSVAEADLHSLVRQFRLPVPLYNPALFAGGEFLAQPDAWWPNYGVVVEVDSRAWHLSPVDWERTLARAARMTAQGILVQHVRPALLRSARADVAKTIKATLARSPGPLPHIVTRTIAAA